MSREEGHLLVWRDVKSVAAWVAVGIGGGVVPGHHLGVGRWQGIGGH